MSSASLLPSSITPAVQSLEAAKILLIGPPKWGKTSFALSNPNALLLAFEAGHAFKSGYKIVIDAWDKPRGQRMDPYEDEAGIKHMTFMQALAALEADKKRFDYVVIDTADNAVKACSDFECAKRGVEHAQDAGDYGKGWDVTQNAPFRKAIARIVATGRGVVFISHTEIAEHKFSSGVKARRECSLPKGIWKVVYPMADLIIQGEFGKKIKTKSGRVQVARIAKLKGDMDTLAGGRIEENLPALYVVEPQKQWEQLKKFFTDPELSLKAEQRASKLVK